MTRQMPDSLVNSLIQNKDGLLRTVVRDDGENGLYVTENEPSNMYRISREDFRENWTVAFTEEERQADNAITNERIAELRRLSGEDGSFRNEQSRNLDKMQDTTLGSILVEKAEMTTERDTTSQRFGALPPVDLFGGRAEPTDRQAMADTIMNAPERDETSSGQPVGGNEDPARPASETPDRPPVAGSEGGTPDGAPTGNADGDNADAHAGEPSQEKADDENKSSQNKTKKADKK